MQQVFDRLFGLLLSFTRDERRFKSQQGVPADHPSVGFCHCVITGCGLVQADDTVRFILLKRPRDSIIPVQVPQGPTQDQSSSDAPESGQTSDSKQHAGPAASARDGGKSKGQSSSKDGKDHHKPGRSAAVLSCSLKSHGIHVRPCNAA